MYAAERRRGSELELLLQQRGRSRAHRAATARLMRQILHRQRAADSTKPRRRTDGNQYVPTARVFLVKY